MKDSNIVGDDGFKIQEYYIHIEKPIYPTEGSNTKEKAAHMREQNYEVWKKVYEDYYKIPLKYTTPPDKMPKY